MLRHRRDVILSVGAAVLGGVCQTAVPLVARQIVDGVILRRSSALWPWLLLLVGLAAASFAFAYVRRYLGGRVALEVQYDLRNAMHDHLQSLDFDNLGRMPTGQLVARANSDSTLVQGLLSFFPIMSSNILLLLLSLGVMLYLSPLLALVSVVVAPSLLIVSYRMRWRIFPATWDGQQREGDLVQIVDEDLNGVRVVKAFGQEQRELERVSAAAQTVYGSQMRAVRLQSRYQPLLEFDPPARAGGHPGPRRMAGAQPPDHAGHIPGVFDVRHPADGAELVSWPASSPSASRHGQGWNASSNSSTCRRRSRTHPTRSTSPKSPARSPSRTSPFDMAILIRC